MWGYKPYKGIRTLPLKNWVEYVETGDNRYLLKGIDFDDLPRIKKDLRVIEDKITNEYLNDLGEKNESLELLMKINRLKLNYWIIATSHYLTTVGYDSVLVKTILTETGKNIKGTLEAIELKIKDLIEQIEKLKKEQKKTNYREMVELVRQETPFGEITVKEFNTILKLAKKGKKKEQKIK